MLKKNDSKIVLHKKPTSNELPDFMLMIFNRRSSAKTVWHKLFYQRSRGPVREREREKL